MSLPPSVLRLVQSSSDQDPLDHDPFKDSLKPKKPILLRLFPFVEEMRTMSISTLRADFMAGLSVAPVAIPQVMAYAVVAGLPPQYGLYAATFAVMVAALWGSSRFLTAGPTNAISMILFATIAHASAGGVVLSTLSPQELMPYIFGITIFAGFLQLCMGFMRLGEISNFISHSVMVGFATGAALLIGVGQLKNALGINIDGSANFFSILMDVFRQAHHFNPWSLGLCAFTVAILVLCRFISRRIPSHLCALVCASALAYCFDFGAHGVSFVASIPAGLPPLSTPPPFDLNIIRDLFNPALAIALLGAVESLTIGKNLTAMRGEKFDGNQELIGQGLGNITAGFTSGMAGCGSFTRSVLNLTAGGKSRLATVFSGLLTIPVIFLCAPLADKIPMPALAGTLLVIAWGMVDRNAVRLCCVATGTDRLVLLATVLTALTFDLEKAVVFGVLLSLTLLVYKEAHPRIKRFGVNDVPFAFHDWVHKCPSVALFFVEGTLFFGAVHAVEEHLQAENLDETKVIVLNLARVFWLDASGAHALGQFAERCHAESIPLILVTNNESIRGTLKRTGVLEHIGEDFVVPTLDGALNFAKYLLERRNCL
ncbi:MAG: SulP family inorganic anion transporter [Pseudomonadota bacterium]